MGWDLTLPSKLVRAFARARLHGLVSDFVGGDSRVFMVTSLKTLFGKKEKKKKVYDSWIPSGSYTNERAREKGPSKGVLNFFPIGFSPC